jgi:hypothetical protein
VDDEVRGRSQKEEWLWAVKIKCYFTSEKITENAELKPGACSG